MCTKVSELMAINKLSNESTVFRVIRLSSKFHGTKHYLELEQQIIFSDRNFGGLFHSGLILKVFFKVNLYDYVRRYLREFICEITCQHMGSGGTAVARG